MADLLRLSLQELTELGAARRDRAWGTTLTFSPKAFFPVTNLCRNRCDYCSFRKSPGDPGEWTMSPEQVDAGLAAAREQGCIEALLCLGDTPETGFREYRALLRSWGHDSTVDYLVWICQRALEHGLLPHTNAGILTGEQMGRLKKVNVSLGLMLESVSERLCEKGMPHHKAPDKRPKKRIAMTAQAGSLKIPFTSGVLIGIGETLQERVQTLAEIARLHAEYSHIQEVIVQNFVARDGIALANAPEPTCEDMSHTVALARLMLDDEISIQAPPNLNSETISALIAAGINDFGGVSPVTPDFINPDHPWPELTRLQSCAAVAGFTLRPRLPIYDRFVDRPGFVDSQLMSRVRSLQRRLSYVRDVSDLPSVHDQGITDLAMIARTA